MGLSCRSQRGKLRLPVGKEAVQKENWLTESPGPPHLLPKAVLPAPRQQVSKAHPHPRAAGLGIEGAGHIPSWTPGALIVSGSSALAGGLGFLVYLKMIVFFIKAPVFAKERGNRSN